MRFESSTMRRVLVLLIVVLLAVGTIAYAGKGGGGKGGGKPTPPTCPNWDLICPDVWDPVICDDGVTYSNQCYADRACATGCESTGGGPVPLAAGLDDPPTCDPDGETTAQDDDETVTLD